MVVCYKFFCFIKILGKRTESFKSCYWLLNKLGWKYFLHQTNFFAFVGTTVKRLFLKYKWNCRLIAVVVTFDLFLSIILIPLSEISRTVVWGFGAMDDCKIFLTACSVKNEICFEIWSLDQMTLNQKTILPFDWKYIS